MSAEAGSTSGRRAWQATRRSDFAVRLGRARRHSRLVRLLRLGIPSGVAAVAGVYGMIGWINPFGALPALDISGLVISRSQVAIDRPRMAGYTRDVRPYELTAASASQDLRQPQFIELKGIRGKVEMRDGDVVSIAADAGRYDTKGETIVLRQNIVVITTDGAEIRMGEAQIDARNGRVISEREVDVISPAGRLNAQKMDVRDGGSVMTFRGGVTMDLQQPQRAQKEASQ